LNCCVSKSDNALFVSAAGIIPAIFVNHVANFSLSFSPKGPISGFPSGVFLNASDDACDKKFSNFRNVSGDASLAVVLMKSVMVFIKSDFSARKSMENSLYFAKSSIKFLRMGESASICVSMDALFSNEVFTSRILTESLSISIARSPNFRVAKRVAKTG